MKLQKNKTNPCYESMSRFSVKCDENSYLTVRIWRTEKGLGPHDNSDIEMLFGTWLRTHKTSNEIIKAICKLPRIAAVEVLDWAGNGQLYYPDWK